MRFVLTRSRVPFVFVRWASLIPRKRYRRMGTMRASCGSCRLPERMRRVGRRAGMATSGRGSAHAQSSSAARGAGAEGHTGRRSHHLGVSVFAMARGGRTPPGAPPGSGSLTGGPPRGAQRMMKKKMEVPEVDTENPQFVIFVRSAKVKMWYPLNMVSGGPLAKGLLKGMDNDFLKGMASGALVTSLRDAIYKDIEATENAARKEIKPLAGAKKLVFGYKVLDPSDPEGSIMPKGVKEIPAEADNTGTSFDGVQAIADNLKDVQKLFQK